MSNFFSKTKGDMKYLFKHSDKLSLKGKRRRKRAIVTLIGLLLVLIQLVLMILFLLKIFKLDLLPLKYVIMMNIILLLLTLYNFTSQFTRAHVLGKLLAVLMSIVLTFGFLFASKLEATFLSISGTSTKTDIVDVIVLKDDAANSIKDAKDYSFGYNSSLNNDIIQKAINDINAENNTVINSQKYYDWDTLLNNLYSNKEIKAIIMNDSIRSTLLEQYTDFDAKTKIIGTIKITTEIKLNASDKKVNEEPFVVFISGNDGYGDISSTGHSDVNILAIIHPKTRQVLLVSTPRDSYVTMSNSDGKTGLDKLTHSGNPGVEYTLKAIEDIYGVNIDYYYKINFSGCEEIVNALGGITINSDVSFTNGLEAAYSRYDFNVGPNECDGQMALAFVRERKAFNDGDFQRGRNQAAAIKGIIDKATSPSILSSYSNVLDAVSDMLYTNMPSSTITALIKGQLANPTSWNVQSYSITGTTGSRDGQVYGLKGMSVVFPDYDSINTAIELINKTINGETFNVDDYIN